MGTVYITGRCVWDGNETIMCRVIYSYRMLKKICFALLFCFLLPLTGVEGKTMTGFVAEGVAVMKYISPVTQKTLYTISIGTTAKQAFTNLAKYATRISDTELRQIPLPDAKKNTVKANRTIQNKYAGRLLTTKTDTKNIWYVSPTDLKRYYYNGTDASLDYIFSYIAQRNKETVASGDCKEDMDCRIEAAKTCAKITFTSTLTPDLVSSGEIRGIENGQCILFMKPKIMMGKTIDSPGLTERERAMLEATTTCRFTNQELVDILTRWKDGSFSSDDTPPSKCDMRIPGVQ